MLSKDLDDLKAQFKNEEIFFIENETVKDSVGKIYLDNIIELYNMPELCNINLEPNETLNLLKTLTRPIRNLIFKFNINELTTLQETLNYLAKLGYESFNFSIRDIPLFILETNKYTNAEKNWTSSQNLISEILESNKLDIDENYFWGYIYAKTNP